MWRWHRDSMQTSTRTVSRARSRALPCSSLGSAETGQVCSTFREDGAGGAGAGGLRGTLRVGEGGREDPSSPQGSQGASRRRLCNRTQAWGTSGRPAPTPHMHPGPALLTHVQASKELEDGGDRGREPTGGQAQARPPQEGALGSGLKGQQGGAGYRVWTLTFHTQPGGGA